MQDGYQLFDKSFTISVLTAPLPINLLWFFFYYFLDQIEFVSLIILSRTGGTSLKYWHVVFSLCPHWHWYIIYRFSLFCCCCCRQCSARRKRIKGQTNKPSIRIVKCDMPGWNVLLISFFSVCPNDRFFFFINLQYCYILPCFTFGKWTFSGKSIMKTGC